MLKIHQAEFEVVFEFPFSAMLILLVEIGNSHRPLLLKLRFGVLACLNHHKVFHKMDSFSKETLIAYNAICLANGLNVKNVENS